MLRTVSQRTAHKLEEKTLSKFKSIHVTCSIVVHDIYSNKCTTIQKQ
jgi:hypothetical protein